ncbi:hypothetical protein JCM11491_002087 [Sporobolomyces phaffii]
MDLDPSIYFQPSSPDPSSDLKTPPAAQSTPLPHVTLPALPRPSVSPASTRVSFTQQQKSGRTSAGLDLSASMQQNSNTPGVGSSDYSLEDEVARARTERAARRAQVGTSFASDSAVATPPASTDARDSASARENIMNLVSAGQDQLAGGPSSAPSLAMFMGGGKGRRVHKVNQEMTEQEKEVTEKLEREMAAARAKWATKPTSDDDESAPSRAGGMSLASLMNRQVGGGSASSSDEPKRWQPSTVSPPAPASEPVRAQTAPAASPAPQSSSSVSTNTPRSLASAFGSTATGPRLNSSSQASIDDSGGPAHARSGGGYAMPGLAKEMKNEDPSNAETKPEPALVEPKVFSRPAPSPAPVTEPTPTPASPNKIAFPSTSNSDPASNTVPPAQNSTLGRLRGSSIVAERLKFAEQRQQQAQSPLSSPTKERGSIPTSPEKRRSVLERWGRDQPNVFGGGSTPASPTKPSSLPAPPRSPGFSGPSSPWSTTGKPISTSPKEESKQLVADDDDPLQTTPSTNSGTQESQQSSKYSKPSWAHAPIGVKSPSDAAHPDEEAPPERKHTRGVALPGLGGPASSPSLPAAPASNPNTAPASPTKQKTDPLPTSSSGGVRAAAMKWGRTESDAQREKREELIRLKESYGVKVDQGGAPRRAVERAPQATKSEAKPRTVETKPARVAEPTSQPPKAATTSTPTSSNPLVDEIVSLVLDPSPPVQLSGPVVSLDVFHLNSPTDNPHPIEHNHILHTSEILGIVARTSGSGATIDDIETYVWVWRGRQAEETAKTRDRITKLEKKTGVAAVQVRHREEPRALVEAFEGQLTICKGLRDQFDHLAERLFIVSSQEHVVFVEETEFTARSLCSGCSAVLSLAGEVYAWLGEGSSSQEREACCQFAESIADGRSLHVLAEGEETQWFWTSLDDRDNVEYSAANYWQRRYEHSPATSIVRVSSSSASRVSTIDASSIHLLDGGSLENYVLVPSAARGDRDAIKAALEAAESLSSKWEDRGFESKTPCHVLLFPSAVPRDLPFLARSVDFDLLNGGTRPRKMNVHTLAEAKQELL